MRAAVDILDSRGADFEYDGEMGADVALNPRAMALYPFCRLSDTANVLVSEIGNILWKKNRRKELSKEQSERAFEFLHANSPILLDERAVSASALRLAQAYDRTFYDSLYLALAVAMGCPLLTADRRFYRSMKQAFPTGLQLVGNNAR